MESYYIIDHLQASFEKEAVLTAIDCTEDSPVYEMVEEEYLSICEEAEGLIEPIGILGFGVIPEKVSSPSCKAGTRVIYAILSVGDKIKQRSTQAFAEGDYVCGMLWDAIADEALFSLEGRMKEQLQEVCEQHGVGIRRRLEAPHDIPMQVQRAAWECLKLKERLGIDISCGYMFDPVKTSCQVFVISEDKELFQAEHDCRKCPNLKCKRRNVQPSPVIVWKDQEKRTILVPPQESLMTALLREGYYISAACGGKGRCGKCKVQVISGEAYITDADRKVFAEQELEAGWRLSCMLYPRDDMEIIFSLQDEEQFQAVTDFQYDSASEHAADAEIVDEGWYDIAIDIGTTTIAFAAVSVPRGTILTSAARINSQRKYGADVISRIKASVDGKEQELRNCITEDLQQGIADLQMKVTGYTLRRIVVSGNTTMGHLLMGYDCQSLGVYPFTPVNIDFICGKSEQMIGTAVDTETELLPGISTYVGGDIVSGMYACGFDQTEEICLLIDLGTNGEMALGNKDRILVTSTAAGPAFEGGNITCGTGSIPGAICSVQIVDGKARIQTIQDEIPTGICGTGVVEITAELLREELVDETGLLDEEYFDDGFPLARTAEGAELVFLQKDIREIQLAKAAIRAGAETLLLRYGVKKEDIKHVYLAGGFGYRLDTDKAVAIGMLPEEFSDRIEAVGNSSLAGAVKYAVASDGKDRLRTLIEVSEEISLSSDKDFNELYMEHMMFGNEW